MRKVDSVIANFIVLQGRRCILCARRRSVLCLNRSKLTFELHSNRNFAVQGRRSSKGRTGYRCSQYSQSGPLASAPMLAAGHKSSNLESLRTVPVIRLSETAG